MEILNQLGELFLAAVPTVIIVFLFYLFMRWSFFTPMERVLSERRKRAEGARTEAEASRVAAHEKLRSYNETVKKARTEIFAEQESQRRRTLEERQATINTARAAAQSALQEAKKGIAADVQGGARGARAVQGQLWRTKLPKPFLREALPGPAIPRAGGRDEIPPCASSRSLQALLLIFFFTALPVLAAEGAEPDPADSTTGLIFRWLNFLIVFGGIGYLIAKHGGAFFRGNAKEIAASIVEATAAKAEADRELHEVEVKVARLDQDVAEMRAEARRNWAAESERLYASGQAEIEKITQAARAELAASERAAQQQVREIAASLAVERAAALVSSRMNAEIRAQNVPVISQRTRKGRELKALAERYAGALVDVALANKQADQVKRELAEFAALVRESPELHSFLSNPSIARAAKHAAIEAIVARMGASRTLRNYLFVIVDQRRAGMLIEIEQAFSRLLDARQGITQATVTSATELTAQERAELGAALAKLTGEKVQAQVHDGCGPDRRRRRANRFDDLRRLGTHATRTHARPDDFGIGAGNGFDQSG